MTERIARLVLVALVATSAVFGFLQTGAVALTGLLLLHRHRHPRPHLGALHRCGSGGR